MFKEVIKIKNGQEMAKDFTKFSKYRQKWASDLRPQKLLDAGGGECKIRRNRMLFEIALVLIPDKVF